MALSSSSGSGGSNSSNFVCPHGEIGLQHNHKAFHHIIILSVDRLKDQRPAADFYVFFLIYYPRVSFSQNAISKCQSLLVVKSHVSQICMITEIALLSCNHTSALHLADLSSSHSSPPCTVTEVCFNTTKLLPQSVRHAAFVPHC